MNALYSQNSSIGYKPQPIDQMRFVLVNGSYSFVSDGCLLLNSERIKNTIGEEAYMKLLRQINIPSHTPYANGKFTDEQLMKGVKPRYIQSLSEIRAYTSALMSDLDSMALSAKQQEEFKQRLEKANSDYEATVEAIKSLVSNNSQTSE